MFESIMNFFKKLGKTENNKETKSKETAKERLHLVLMQDRANVSADFLEMMKQEIIEVIKKYIEVDEKEIDVRLTNEVKDDGTTGAPSLYANIPIVNIKNEMKKEMNQKAETEKREEEEKAKAEDKEKPVEDVEKEEKNEEKIEEPKQEEDKNEKEEVKEEKEEIETKVEVEETENKENNSDKKSGE